MSFIEDGESAIYAPRQDAVTGRNFTAADANQIRQALLDLRGILYWASHDTAANVRVGHPGDRDFAAVNDVVGVAKAISGVVVLGADSRLITTVDATSILSGTLHTFGVNEVVLCIGASVPFSSFFANTITGSVPDTTYSLPPGQTSAQYWSANFARYVKADGSTPPLTMGTVTVDADRGPAGGGNENMALWGNTSGSIGWTPPGDWAAVPPTGSTLAGGLYWALFALGPVMTLNNAGVGA